MVKHNFGDTIGSYPTGKLVYATNGRLYGVTNSIVKTSKDKLVVIQGLDGYIVAEYGNVLMICQKEQEQFVKNFVADASKRGIEFV